MSSATLPARSYLFVPGDRPDRFNKALAAGADAVIVDLEDAVAPAAKDGARDSVSKWLRDDHAVVVRINAADTPWFEADLRLCAQAGVTAVMLPKAEDTKVLERVRKAAPGRTLLPLIETALGFERLRSMASARGVERLVFGSIDFQLDLGMNGGHAELLPYRAAIVLASRLAGLHAPVDGVSTAIDDLHEVQADVQHARRLGFAAKLCIHPRQVAIVNAGFSPGADEIAWARRLLDAAEKSSGAAVAVDGKMVDKPVLLRAQAIVRAAAGRTRANGDFAGKLASLRGASQELAVSPGSPEIAFPLDVLQKWQRIVDLLANVMQVPSAVLTKLEPPADASYIILASSISKENPFSIDEIFSMDIGTFCETVIKSRESLLVIDARNDDRWKFAPELKVGMVSYLGLPVLWPDGRMFGTICVLDDKANQYSDVYQQLLLLCRDVLQDDLQTLIRLDNELEDQRAHLSQLFARVPEAMAMVDLDFRITRINPEFTRLFGYSVGEAVGQEISELIAPDDLHDEFSSLRSRMIQEEDIFAIETVRRRKDGTRVPVSVMCVPVPSKDGAMAGYVIHRDLTEAKRLQHEQQRYHKIELELAHANRSATLGLLSASIAHELNQPLSGVITNSDVCLRLLASSPINLDGVRETVRRIMRDGDRAAEVTKRLRALFAKKEQTLETVDLNDATREVIALSLGEFQNSGVVLRTELAADLEWVRGDRIQLQQVVLNLLRNALESMSLVDGPKDLLVKTERDEGGSVRLSVKDAGVGFDEQLTNRLFDAFYSTKNGGMGVGLALSRSIIENHHGSLVAAPNNGPGATFSFAIPRQIRPDEFTH